MSIILAVGKDADAFKLIQRDKEVDLVGFVTNSREETDRSVLNLGTDDDWAALSYAAPELKALLLIDPPRLREKLFSQYSKDNKAVTYIALELKYPDSVSIGKGSFIQEHCYLSQDVFIGIGYKINVGAYLHHNSKVGDFCTVAPKACILGGALIGDRVYVGAGAIILQNLSVVSDVIIGAGAVVTRNITEPGTYIGVPARNVLLGK